MAKSDFYETLGVAKNASAEDIKKAYRKLAMQYHPDKNAGNDKAEHKFKEINEAYDILKDDQKRGAYDRFGHQAFEGGGPRPGGGGGFGNFSDIFEEMFGQAMGRGGGGRAGESGGAGRGSDLRYNLEVTLEDAFKGSQTTIRIPSWAPCEACHGSGANNGAEPVACTGCHGSGRVRAQQGFFTVERTCPTCGGMGKIIKDPCRACGSSGRVRKEKTLQVNIPAGVEDGTRIRLAGEGETGLRGGPSGDLYVFLSIKPHRFFQRDGTDLHCKVPITMPMAALGGTIDVPTIDGKRSRVTIPAGTQSGQQMRLKGKGMSVYKSAQRGDLYIETNVEIPVNLSKRQQELLKEFQTAGGKASTHPQSEKFFGRVKELWEDLTE